MTPRFNKLLLAVPLLALAGLALSASAQAQPVTPLSGPGRAAQPAPFYYNLPGYWMLQQEPVRKEIELVPDQETKLQEIARQYQEKMQKVYAPLQNKDLSPEDRAKLYKEMGGKFQELQQWVGQQVKEVLLPHQITALEKIDLRMKAAGYLQAPVVMERLGLTAEQKEKVKKNRGELAEKMYQLQKDSFEELVKILTPEQLEKLKQPWPGSQPGGPMYGAPPAKK